MVLKAVSRMAVDNVVYIIGYLQLPINYNYSHIHYYNWTMSVFIIVE